MGTYVYKTDLKFSTVCEKMSENRRSHGGDFLTHTVYQVSTFYLYTGFEPAVNFF